MPEDLDTPDVELEVDNSVEVVEGWLEVDDVDDYLDELHGVEDRHGVAVQAFDTRYLTGPRHLRFAAGKARRAFERGEEVADSFGMELMLYAAGTRQISAATEIGVSAGGCPTADADTPNPSNDPPDMVSEQALEAVEETLKLGDADYFDRSLVREFFEVSDIEVEAVGERKLSLLVLERVSLLDINK